MGIIYQTFPGSFNPQSKAVSQCSQKAFKKDSSPSESLTCSSIPVESCEKISYPIFPTMFTRWLMTDGSSGKIKTQESWATNSSSDVFEKIRQICSFLGLGQPHVQVHGLISREMKCRLDLSPIQPLRCTFSPKQRPCRKSSGKAAPPPTARFLLNTLSLCNPPSATQSFQHHAHALYLADRILQELNSVSQCWTFILHSNIYY